MQTLMAESGGLTRDDVFTALMDLGKSGAVHVVKNFNISVQHGKSEDSFFKLLNHSLEIILDIPFGKVHTFKRKKYEQDLKNWYSGQLLKSAKQKDLSKYDVRKINREVIRVINTSLRIFRYANIEIDEQINSSGESTYSYVISQSVGYKVKSILDDIVNKIRRMHDLFESVHKRESQDGDNDSFDIKLEELFLHFEDESLSFSRIIQIIKLYRVQGFLLITTLLMIG